MNADRHGVRSRPARALGAVPHASAFTLIEVLLALALTTMLVTLTGRITMNSMAARQAAGRIVAELDRETVVFDRLDDDFANILDALPGENSPIKLLGSPRPVLQLSTLSPVGSAVGALHLPRRPARVRYRLKDNRGTDASDLVRETIDLTVPGAKPVPETIAVNVASFAVVALHDGEWLRTYLSNRRDSSQATAVRVSLRWLDSKRAYTQTFTVLHGP